MVADLIQRVAEVLPAPALEVLAQVEKEVRRDWGGEEQYVRRVGESPGKRFQRVSQRDEAIRRDHGRGERADLLSRRYRISKRRIHQILRRRETLP